MLRPLRTRDDVLAALPDDLLVRQLAAHFAPDLPAYAHDGAVALYHQTWAEPDPTVVGDPAGALVLARHLLAEHDVPWLSVPVATGAALAGQDGLREAEGWAFRWTGEAPGLPVAGDPEWCADEAEVAAVLKAGFPDASMPVGHRDVRRWAGLRRDGRLVAIAADASIAPGLGFLASITTLPEVRGTGAGAAVTAWATGELVAEHGACGLWLMAENTVAAALYTRLGYADDHPMVVVTKE